MNMSAMIGAEIQTERLIFFAGAHDDLLRRIRVRLRQDHRELVPGHASEEVGGAQARTDALDHGAQEPSDLGRDRAVPVTQLLGDVGALSGSG